MSRQPTERYKNREQIRKNIKTIRCWLELTTREFAEKTGIPYKRAFELETTFSATDEEIAKIAGLAQLQPSVIIKYRLYTSINIA